MSLGVVTLNRLSVADWLRQPSPIVLDPVFPPSQARVVLLQLHMGCRNRCWKTLIFLGREEMEKLREEKMLAWEMKMMR